MAFNRFPGGLVGFYPYPIGYSCRYNDDDSPNMTWTPGSAATSSQILTVSFWFKRGNLGALMYVLSGGAGTDEDWIGFDANDKLIIGFDNNADGQYVTTQTFKDPTTHYHICIGIDTTQATASDRVTLEVNGSEVTSFSTETDPAQNYNMAGFIQNGVANYISRLSSAASNYLDGYLSEMYVIDGTKHSASDFGEFKYGIWRPKNPGTLTYGTNGFYLDFADASDLGDDESGNTNDWTEANLATNDRTIDTPTNNHCVLNVVHEDNVGTFSNGNLEVTGTNERAFGTFTQDGGKFAWQITANENADFGIRDQDDNEVVASDLSGEVIEMLMDLDNGTLKKKVDGGSVEDIDLALTNGQEWTPYFKGDCDVDFGQLGFTSTVGGYKTLCSRNMTDPSIKDGTTGHYSNTRTGTGAEATISDVNFDVSAGALVWIKSHDNAWSHTLEDTVRGATLELSTDSNQVEATEAQSVKSFSSTGYVLGTFGRVNTNTHGYVDWVFREGDDYGFDIVTYTGTGTAHTESHGLSAAPELIMIKDRDALNSWAIYCEYAASDAETDWGQIDTNAAFADDNTIWNDTAPTSSVFTVGTAGNVNTNTEDYVAYLFRSVSQYMKVFYYTGNGNANGPYVHLGFRPAFIMIKEVPATSPWSLFTNALNGYNPDNDRLDADGAGTKGTSDLIDFLGNGFKLRSNAGDLNTNTNLYIGLAIAEQPGKWSNAV